MAYEKWTRKLTTILKEWGFEEGEHKATSHTKWTYKGPKAQRSVTVVVPTHIKSSSRAVTIAKIKTNLRRAGVSEADLEAFNKLALGLMQAEPADDFDDLEEKLTAAIASNRIVDVAEIALEIGKRAAANGQTNYKSRAIEDVKQKVIAAANVEVIRRKIDKLLLQQVQMMMRTHFASGEDFTVSRGGTFAADSMTELPHELYDAYGIRFTNCETDDYSADIEAVFTGDADGHFVKDYGVVRFRAGLSLELDDNYATTEDSKDFYSVTTLLPHGRTLQELQALHKAIESVVTVTALKQQH
jgi:hypothetical protein